MRIALCFHGNVGALYSNKKSYTIDGDIDYRIGYEHWKKYVLDVNDVDELSFAAALLILAFISGYNFAKWFLGSILRIKINAASLNSKSLDLGSTYKSKGSGWCITTSPIPLSWLGSTATCRYPTDFVIQSLIALAYNVSPWELDQI